MDDFFQSRDADESLDDVGSEIFEHAYLLGRLQDLRGDDFVLCLKNKNWTYRERNEYLRELLDWERAPMRFIYNCLSPKPIILDTRVADDSEISRALFSLVSQLRKLNHVILYADHLSDRRLYRLIVQNVLPCELKFLPNAKSPVYWNFCSYTETRDYDDEEEETNVDECDCAREQNWLSYYATDTQRRSWLLKFGKSLPPKMQAPHRRAYIRDRVSFH